MLSVSRILLMFATSFATARTLPNGSNHLILLNSPSNISFPAPILNFPVSAFPSSLTLFVASHGAATKLVPRFNDTVYDAKPRTTAQYPRAVLIEAGTTSVVGPTINPDDYTDVRPAFSYRVGPYRRVLVTMEAWGQVVPKPHQFCVTHGVYTQVYETTIEIVAVAPPTRKLLNGPILCDRSNKSLLKPVVIFIKHFLP
ncbi:MAG: hypothetical protein ASARMPREDX12_005129 [Alectoria sarmentosa]|nr:MAG: hypothetical protein ASARMPREDX12_005129 [Alectoria sarmentosa]CAD6593898.1 MAG: hypothetical protein ASARMPRED_008175 [Alectoria sarmentosa]